MADELVEVFGNEIVKKTAESIFKTVVAFLKRSKSAQIPISEEASKEENYELLRNVTEQFDTIYNWSNELEFIDARVPISVAERTINLSFSFSPVSSHSASTDIKSENEIIFGRSNAVIEGYPGSGKTTSLKRILLDYFQYTLEKRAYPYSYPILVRVRQIPSDKDLYRYICDTLGIAYTTTHEDFTINAAKSIKVEDYKTVSSVEVNRIKHIRVTSYHIGNVAIDKAICRFLNESKILLIVDGLDEAHPDIVEKINKQIATIALSTTQSKLVITTRPNYITKTITNTIVYQIQPLSANQMKDIIKLWLPNNRDFLKQLSVRTYFELANRPLFLCYLILIYKSDRKKRKELPPTSKEVYERIIEVLLEEWDDKRAVERESTNKYFSFKRKIDFLSHFSYHLTCVVKTKEFTHDMFVEIYGKISARFQLPIEDAESVAAEIESHTGLITKSVYKKYEFSHLSIQEYLCAKYISTSVLNDSVIKYANSYPEPLAVAVGLSSNSSAWLFELVRAVNSQKSVENFDSFYIKLINRLCIETPFFERNETLALSIIHICHVVDASKKEFLSSLHSLLKGNFVIIESLNDLLNIYRLGHMYKDETVVKFYKDDLSLPEEYPKIISLPRSTCNLLKIKEYPKYWPQ